MPARPIHALVCLALSLAGLPGLAKPIHAGQAAQAVARWLERTPSPLGAALGGRAPAEVLPVTTEDGSVLYYAVNWAGGGFVALAADDELEPVLAFSARGSLTPGSPLTGVLRQDLQGRMRGLARQAEAGSRGDSRSPAKWATLLATAPEDGNGASAPVYGLDDPRVDPLLQGRWGDPVYSGNCYDYYTPNNDPSPDVVIQVAQLLRFHQWPQAGVGSHEYPITVDGAYRKVLSRGGDALGGPYPWAQMPLALSPAYVPDAQRAAIGALMYDIGIALGTAYEQSFSWASRDAIKGALRGLFQFGNATYCRSQYLVGNLDKVFLANLDAGLPVLATLTSSGYLAGEVICDGYGYNHGTLYLHVNFNLGGYQDAWYDLGHSSPDGTLDTVLQAIYNIYPQGQGEILSGRVLDKAGNPLAGASIVSGGISATSNARGIYALKGLLDGYHNVTASLPGYYFPPVTGQQTFDMGDDWYPGNVWGANFTESMAMAPSIFAISPTSGSAGAVVTLTGAGFNGTTQITFGGVKAVVYAVLSDTTLSIRIPDGAQSGPVQVSSAAGVATSPWSFRVLPVISVDPAMQHAALPVVFKGWGFTGALQVSFGGVPAVFNVDSDTQITAIVPSGAKGLLSITLADGIVCPVPGLFTLYTFPEIFRVNPVSAVHGSKVVLYGIDLLNVSKVTFSSGLKATCQASFTVDSNSQITAVVPPTASSGALWVDYGIGTTVLLTVVPSGLPGDWTGDIRPSLFWRQAGTGQVQLTPMAGPVRLPGSGVFWTEPDPAWQIVGSGDFDGDGQADLLWWNSRTGQVYQMLMDGGTIKAGAIIYTEPDTTWRIVGVGDFDGDGKSDLLWRNSRNGQVYMMLLDGARILSGSVIYTEPNPDWQIVACGDFDGDGRTDIVWRNAATGAVYQMLYLSANGRRSQIYQERDLAWKIVGAGDFTGSGKAGLVWRHDVTGAVYLMPLDGDRILPGAIVYTEPNFDWQIVSIADLDGDFKADLLWWNRKSGQVYQLLLDGNTIKGQGMLSGLPDVSWSPQAAGSRPQGQP